MANSFFKSALEAFQKIMPAQNRKSVPTPQQNAHEYTFEEAKQTGNYELFYFAAKDYKSQCWMYSKKVGDEIRVFTDYNSDKHPYMMDWEIPLPPKLVNLYPYKKGCRLYVYSINDTDPEYRTIEIMAAYQKT